MLSGAVTFALLLVGSHLGAPEQGPAAGAASAADIVWSYDTGG
jgi:hypothetical protein